MVMAVTLANVAREAGVSIAASSSVLGARPSTTSVSPATRERILEVAQRLGYRPNPNAAALITGRTRNIGLMMQSPATVLNHPNSALFFGLMISSAAERGYRITILDPNPKAEIDPRVIDGCLVLGFVGKEISRKLAELAATKPVLTDREQIEGAIVVDEDKREVTKGYRIAAEYLYELGHRHIAVTEVYGSHAPYVALSSFEAVAREREIEPELPVFVDRWQLRTYPTTDEICRLDPLPTAVFAFDDDYARMLISKLCRMGMRVPEDVSVYSGETHRKGFQLAPPLTGSEFHYEDLSLQKVMRFIDIIDSEDCPKSIRVELPTPELVERESCAPPRTNGKQGNLYGSRTV